MSWSNLRILGLAVNGIGTGTVQFAHTVNGVAYYIHQTAFDLVAYRHCDRAAQGVYFHSSLQTIGAVHGYRTDGVFTDVLLHFHNQAFAVVSSYLEGVVDGWKNGLGFRTFE